MGSGCLLHTISENVMVHFISGKVNLTCKCISPEQQGCNDHASLVDLNRFLVSNYFETLLQFQGVSQFQIVTSRCLQKLSPYKVYFLSGKKLKVLIPNHFETVFQQLGYMDCRLLQGPRCSGRHFRHFRGTISQFPIKFYLMYFWAYYFDNACKGNNFVGQIL